MRRLLLILLCCVTSWEARAQIGGQRAFDFLELPLNARLAGLGGVNVSTSDQDVNLQTFNPALLREEMTGYLSLNYVPFYADINSFGMAYAFDTEKLGPIGLSFGYHNYGTVPETDASGAVMGEFRAADFYVGGTYARTIGVYTLGGTVKLAGSSIGDYNAYAAAVDLGATFNHPTRDFHVGLVVRNLGWAFDAYHDGDETPVLPLNIQLGASYKLEHMPLRFSLTANNLQQPDITYLDPAANQNIGLGGPNEAPSKSLGDQILRHVVVGGEFVLSQNFHVRAGYNHLINRELRLATGSRGAGFSLGAMARIKSFEVAFSRAFYHAVGGTSYLTVTSDLNRIFKSPSAQ